jgi:hypothetical protein
MTVRFEALCAETLSCEDFEIERASGGGPGGGISDLGSSVKVVVSCGGGSS